MDASVPFEKIRSGMLQDDELASLYLGRALAENEHGRVRQVLEHLARARIGGLEHLLERTGLSRKQFDDMLAGEGIQSGDTLERIHRALGLPSVTRTATTGAENGQTMAREA